MSLPTVVQLHRCGFDVRLVGRGWAKDLLAGLGLPLTAVPKGITATSRQLRKLPTDHGLLFTNSLSSALSMRLAGIQVIGYAADCRRSLLRTALAKTPGLHEVEYYWRLGTAAAACWARPPLNWPDTPPAKIQLPLTND